MPSFTTSSRTSLLLLLALLFTTTTTTTHAFFLSTPTPAPARPTTTTTMSAHRQVSRSDMLKQTTTAATATLLFTSAFLSFPSLTLAADNTAVEDLSPPSAQELEQARVAAKLKRQQEALVQEGAAKGGGEEGKNYGDSLKREQEKQKALKKDKKQRREDLCEKLGRGC